MSENEFVDYYELLQLSPNADAETVDRVFRHLAMKYHPDHTNLSDNERFSRIVEAHQTLADPEARASYDVRYQEYWNRKWRLAADAGDSTTFINDKEIRERLLSLLYVQRRRDLKNPGLGEHEMARLLRTPPELVSFHLWYIKAKGWVERLETGHIAITALGVDQAEQSRQLLQPERLIEDQRSTEAARAENEAPE